MHPTNSKPTPLSQLLARHKLQMEVFELFDSLDRAGRVEHITLQPVTISVETPSNREVA